MRRFSHGGRCCGINHLVGFDRLVTKEQIQAEVNRVARPSQSMTLEVVLTNRQCKAHPNIPKWLQECGFKVVSRFKNPNSGNICNVFHYNKAPKSLTSRLPFKIVEADK